MLSSRRRVPTAFLTSGPAISDLLGLAPQWPKSVLCNKSLHMYSLLVLFLWITPDWHSLWMADARPKRNGAAYSGSATIDLVMVCRGGGGVLRGIFRGRGGQDGGRAFSSQTDCSPLELLNISSQTKAVFLCSLPFSSLHLSLWRRPRRSMPKPRKLHWTHLMSLKKWSPDSHGQIQILSRETWSSWSRDGPTRRTWS